MNAPEPPADADAPSEASAGSGALDQLEQRLLGESPTLTQVEVSEQAGIELEASRALWHLLGFAHTDPDDRAFTQRDVDALRLTQDLMDLGILSHDRQDGLVRTLGRSFARLAEWQVGLLADIATETGVDSTDALVGGLAETVLPKVEELQNYVWRRHLVSVTSRLLASTSAGARTSNAAVCFVDIVGYTTRSRTLTDRELVAWLEAFETAALDIVIENGGRIIKNIGDELLIVADTPQAAAAIALELTRRGADEDDGFPSVRAGVAYGEVVTRLGDVFGPVVNIAARLTSVARPGTVLVDRGLYAGLTGADAPEVGEAEHVHDEASPYRFRRVRRLSVKGYSRLQAWALSAA
ncbi:adenylate/guanylate cyclase domain-containing protein [Nocardioides stalactiti]|uniref:adenylate/guanylate cyclase domain-containing protein n=1 Tax=Nocardioides stalactiti TaxID=2755356 RepID=UPI0016023161|nr:adenylate/guanylate cyclase domain-containing protein [Nocardioides stalactiti]